MKASRSFFDLVVGVGKGLKYGGKWENDPFVATAVISDDDTTVARAGPTVQKAAGIA